MTVLINRSCLVFKLSTTIYCVVYCKLPSLSCTCVLTFSCNFGGCWFLYIVWISTNLNYCKSFILILLNIINVSEDDFPSSISMSGVASIYQSPSAPEFSNPELPPSSKNYLNTTIVSIMLTFIIVITDRKLFLSNNDK